MGLMRICSAVVLSYLDAGFEPRCVNHMKLLDNEGLQESKIKMQHIDQARLQEVNVLERWGMHGVWDLIHGEGDDRP